jgi:hypothetical protein
MSKKDVSELLRKIQRKASAPVKEAPPAAAPAASAPRKKIGKAVQFWFHDEDRQQIRELYAWLAGQGHRPSDSAILRAALRMAKPGAELLEAYREAAKLDGSVKRE